MKRKPPVKQLVLVAVIAAIGIAAAFGLDVSFVCSATPELCGAVLPAPTDKDAGP